MKPFLMALAGGTAAPTDTPGPAVARHATTVMREIGLFADMAGPPTLVRFTPQDFAQSKTTANQKQDVSISFMKMNLELDRTLSIYCTCNSCAPDLRSADLLTSALS